MSVLSKGDEVTTGENSYLWIYLFDGTVLRLSPESSLTMRELNIGVQENFVHLRLNAGNMYWHSRIESSFVEKELRETDTQFLPLPLNEANDFGIEISENEANEEDLFKFMIQDQPAKRQTQRLNQLITKNNNLTRQKRTFSYVVLPNTTMAGYDMHAEFIVLPGGFSYVKQRPNQAVAIADEASRSTLKLFYRGFENTRELTLREGIWYAIDERGRNIDVHQASSLFKMGEFITSHTPTIYVARELLLERYSRFAFQEISAVRLAQEYGYRKWGSLAEKGSDLFLRLEFLKEHTRKLETANLNTAVRFRDRLQARGESLPEPHYSARFFNQALVHYKRDPEVRHQMASIKEEFLNSTKKPFWRLMKARKIEQAR